MFKIVIIITGILIWTSTWSKEVTIRSNFLPHVGDYVKAINSDLGSPDTITPKNIPDTVKQSDQQSDTLRLLQKRVDSRTLVFNKPHQHADSISSMITQTSDSLTKLTTLPAIQLPRDTTIKLLDLNKVNNKISGEAQATVDDVTKKVQNKTAALAEKATSKAKDITGANPNIPSNKLPGIPETELPPITGTQTQELPDIKTELPSTEIPTANVEVPEIKQPDINLPQVDKVEMPGEISDVQEQTSKVTESLKEAEQYQAEIKKIKEEGADTEALSKKAEKQVENLDEVKGVKESVGQVSAKQTEYESMIQRYRDKKMVQEELKRKIVNVANEKVSQLTPDIGKAHNALLKGKKIQQEKSTLKDLLKGKNNTMAGKPLAKRLVPGITLQVYNRSIYTVDWGVQLGYRLSGKITTGIGGVYRLGINKFYTCYVRSLNVYGARIYTDMLVKKGFFIHAEGEWLNTSAMVVTQQPTNERPGKKVVAGYFGIGKQYPITRRLQGNLVALYRATFTGQLPEQSKVNLRMGFNLLPKKKKKHNNL